MLGATNETLNPTLTSSATDFTCVANIFGQLLLVIGEKIVLSAAESVTPNAGASAMCDI